MNVKRSIASSLPLQLPEEPQGLSTSSITLMQCSMQAISGMADAGVDESIKRRICNALRGEAAGNVAVISFLYSERRWLKKVAWTASARICAADDGGAESIEARKCCWKDSRELKLESKEYANALRSSWL